MRILLVEDDPDLAEAVVRRLRRQGHAVDWQGDGRKAYEVLGYTPFDLVLLDFGACRRYSPKFSQGYRRLFTAALVQDNAAMAQALSDIGFFSQQIVPEQKQAVLNLVTMACEPLMQDAVFDFGNTDLALRLREAGTALSLQQNYWHAPPADAIFLHRKIAGLYLLAARLKARVNVRALLPL